jgi:hypothetical protein
MRVVSRNTDVCPFRGLSRIPRVALEGRQRFYLRSTDRWRQQSGRACEPETPYNPRCKWGNPRGLPVGPMGTAPPYDDSPFSLSISRGCAFLPCCAEILPGLEILRCYVQLSSLKARHLRNIFFVFLGSLKDAGSTTSARFDEVGRQGPRQEDGRRWSRPRCP